MKIKKTLIIIILFIFLMPVLIFLVIVGYNYHRLTSGELVKYDGKFYTKEGLHKTFSSQVYHVQAKNTPEGVYTQFRQALVDNDTKKALSFIFEPHQARYREGFKNKEKVKTWISKSPEHIELEVMEENTADYKIDMHDNEYHDVNFIKMPNGYWKIENI